MTQKYLKNGRVFLETGDYKYLSTGTIISETTAIPKEFLGSLQAEPATVSGTIATSEIIPKKYLKHGKVFVELGVNKYLKSELIVRESATIFEPGLKVLDGSIQAEPATISGVIEGEISLLGSLQAEPATVSGEITFVPVGGIYATLAGDVAPSILQSALPTSEKTLIINIVGDTLIADISPYIRSMMDAITSNRTGLTNSFQNDIAHRGWTGDVKVSRTSNTQITVRLNTELMSGRYAPYYNLYGENEVVSVTVPNEMLTTSILDVSAGSFTIIASNNIPLVSNFIVQGEGEVLLQSNATFRGSIQAEPAIVSGEITVDFGSNFDGSLQAEPSTVSGVLTTSGSTPVTTYVTDLALLGYTATIEAATEVITIVSDLALSGYIATIVAQIHTDVEATVANLAIVGHKAGVSPAKFTIQYNKAFTYTSLTAGITFTKNYSISQKSLGESFDEICGVYWTCGATATIDELSEQATLATSGDSLTQTMTGITAGLTYKVTVNASDLGGGIVYISIGGGTPVALTVTGETVLDVIAGATQVLLVIANASVTNAVLESLRVEYIIGESVAPFSASDLGSNIIEYDVRMIAQTGDSINYIYEYGVGDYIDATTTAPMNSHTMYLDVCA